MQDFRLFLVSCDRPSSSETSLIQADVLVYYYTPLTLRLAYCFQFFTKSNVIEVFFFNYGNTISCCVFGVACLKITIVLETGIDECLLIIASFFMSPL